MFKKTKKEMNKPFEHKQVLTLVTYFILILFVVSTAFDLAVTVTVAVYNPDIFYAREANTLFKDSMTKGRPLLNLPMFLNFSYLVLVLVVHEQYNKKPNRFWGTFLTAFLVGAVVHIAGHALGGYSWLVLGPT